MKNIRLLTFVLTISTLILGACSSAAQATPAAPEPAASAKAIAMPVAFVGIVERVTGDQWVISGTTFTVDASIVRDGPYQVGDRVKVEGLAYPDGSFTVSRLEAPRPQETATVSPFTDDNSNDSSINANANTNEAGGANTNDDNSSSVNTNDDQGGSVNANDDSSNDDNSNSTNTNDDSGKDENANDDKGGNSNSDESSGKDDNSGSGGDDNGNGG